MQIIEHPEFDPLTTTVARTLALTCAEALESRGSAVLALAGGSTPIPVYHRLADTKLDWSRIVLLPGDDRWTAHNERACNLRAIREAFLNADADFRALTPEDPKETPNTAVAEATLAELRDPFDACVLGMGTDGHFASLFPGTAGLAEALNPAGKAQAVVVHPSPLPADAPFARVSLTLSRITASRRLLLLIRGEEKRKILQRAMEEGDPQQLPVAALLQHAGNLLEIHWSP